MLVKNKTYLNKTKDRLSSQKIIRLQSLRYYTFIWNCQSLQLIFSLKKIG